MFSYLVRLYIFTSPNGRILSMTFHLFTAILLFFLGIGVSFISTNTGGGALISIPTLILFGFNPIVAIATTKFGHLGTMLAGLYRFHRSKAVKYHIAIPATITASIGAFIGANFLILIPESWLPKMISVLIVIVLLLTWLSGLGIRAQTPHKGSRMLGLILFFFIGVWGGIFGAQAIFATFVLLCQPPQSETV